MANHKLRSFFNNAVGEGAASQVFNGLAGMGNSFLTKLLTSLNATPEHFSLMSVAGQASQFCQLFGVLIMGHCKSRRNLLTLFYFISRLAVVLVGALPLIMYGHPLLIELILLIYFTSSLLTAIAGNIWTGWVADMVPNSIRGRFFAARDNVSMICGVIAAYLASWFVDSYGGTEKAGNFNPENLRTAVFIVFVVAAFFGVLAIFWLRKQPDKGCRNESAALFLQFKDAFRDGNFRKLLFFGIWWMFAIGVGSPFWGPFMMKTLEMSMVQVQIYSTCSLVGTVLFIKFWGRFIDRAGNKPAAILLILIGAFNPLPWLFAGPGKFYIIYVEAISSGVMWAGFGIVTMNFVMAIAPQGKQQLYSGLYAMIPGIGSTVSMLISGKLLPFCDFQDTTGLYPEQVQFAASAFLRLTALIPLVWIAEKRALPLRQAIKLLFKRR